VKESLPQQYLFFNDARIKVRTSRESEWDAIKGVAWHRRLVDLAKSTVVLNESDGDGEGEGAGEGAGDGAIKLDVYMGFDPNLSTPTLSLSTMLLYSRGRLIHNISDPRDALGLNKSSTECLQGLTIVIDDVEDIFELTPTKEGIVMNPKARRLELDREIGRHVSAFWWVGGQFCRAPKLPPNYALPPAARSSSA